MAEPELEIDILSESPLWSGHEQILSQALAAAAAAEVAEGAVSLLLGDDAAVSALNRRFRGKAGPTNVLSFPPAQAASEPGYLGDIALAAETVAKEAELQGKKFEHHAAHLAVHGLLHLLGYDHEDSAEAERMEARERSILASLGIEDPYA